MDTIFKIVFLTNIACCVSAYTWGLDKTACEFFTPSHIGRNRSPPDGFYTLSSNKIMFSPGETIGIKVEGNGDKMSGEFSGILISVRKDDASVGSWQDSSDFRTVDCDSKLGSALAEINNLPKFAGEHTLEWTAPDTCDYEQVYTVQATIVKSKREFLTDVILPLKCVRPSLDRKADSCTRGYHNIPEGSITSFEPGTSSAWTNATDTKLFWNLHKGSTYSPGTGPKEAHDGEYYIYMESSMPSRPGQRAILESPEGLAGCICFRFWYHKYTDKHTKLSCSVNGRNVPCLHPNAKNMSDSEKDSWISSWISINEPGDIKIKIIAQKGLTFRGDVGLDDFVITPGLCKEDRMDKV